MVCAPVLSIIPSLKLGDYLSVQAHKPCSISHLYITNAKQYHYRLGRGGVSGPGVPSKDKNRQTIKMKSMLVTNMQLVRSTTLYTCITDVKKYRYKTQECVEGGGGGGGGGVLPKKKRKH